jgi:hypothetical protein
VINSAALTSRQSFRIDVAASAEHVKLAESSTVHRPENLLLNPLRSGIPAFTAYRLY